MTIRPIDIQQRQRLIIFFAGWGMDEKPFASLRHPGYDTAIAFDYRRANETPAFPFSDYTEICIVAWSFGVINAADFIDRHPELPITATIAVNGTLHPVHNAFGIPESTFSATLAALTPASLMRFYRRVCGSAAALQELKDRMPERNIDELAAELRDIAAMPHRPDLAAIWDTVYVSSADMIIPTANQLNAWEEHTDVRHIDGPHMADIRQIISDCIINKPLVATRFSKSSATYNDNATAQRKIVGTMAELISGFNTVTNPDIIEIGAGTGMLSRHLATMTTPRQLRLWDITPISSGLPGIHQTADGEIEIRQTADGSADIIASASTIQWFNSPASFIREAMRTLRPGGIIALSTFGPDTFRELNPYTHSPLHYPTCMQWQRILLNSGFSDICINEDRISLEFDSPTDMLRHIKMTGVNARTTDTRSARAIIKSGIRNLTYNPVYLLARKPFPKK